LESLGISVTLPIVVCTEKIGTIFMAENASSGVPTKHIVTRYHFIRGHMDGIIKIIFARTEENEDDVFTNSVIRDKYEKQVVKFLGKVMED
jgi:hypothetical protein